MTPPFLSYTTFDRMGLTARNLKKILDADEDFEMHIVDSNSKDDTWEYLQSINDSRIKSKTRFPVNAGPIYALNFNLAKRRPDQYFITINNDIYIKTKNWISCFMEVFKAFPEVGLLGVPRAGPYPGYLPPVIPRAKGNISYLQLKNGFVDVLPDFVQGSCQCLKPELIKEVGFWSEECGWGDAELSARVNNYTSFKAGYVITVDIEMSQTITCGQCPVKGLCKLDKRENTCFSVHDTRYKGEPFANKFKWKYLELFKEMQEGKRTAYCASIFDPVSTQTHLYHQDWAMENFAYYIENSN